MILGSSSRRSPFALLTLQELTDCLGHSAEAEGEFFGDTFPLSPLFIIIDDVAVLFPLGFGRCATYVDQHCNFSCSSSSFICLC